MVDRQTDKIDGRTVGRWRVNWGGIFAGAMVTLAAFLVLSTLGTAIGFTVGDQAPGTGTAVWIALSALVALFCGGYVSSQWIDMETRMEAGTNGVALWSVVFLTVAYLAVNGIQTGFSTIMGLSGLVANATALSADDLARLQEQLGLTDQQMGNLQQQLESQLGGIFTASRAQSASWWSFLGILVSLGAAVSGSIAGTRSSFVLKSARSRRGREELQPPRAA